MLSLTAASYSPAQDGLQYSPIRTAPWRDSGISGDRGGGNLVPAGGAGNAQLVSEYYSSDSLYMTYSNADGDTVSLSMEHVEYQKAMLNVDGGMSPGQWRDMVDYITEQFKQLQSEMIDRFVDSLNGDAGGETGAVDERASVSLEGLPEYWNAENTSQRIVDFAVSFYGAFEGAGDEFLSIIRDAIDQGFSQARDMLGELPGAVDDLINETYDLVMNKLDEWATAQGIMTGQDAAVSEAA